MIGHDLPAAEGLDPVQHGDRLDPPADDRRVDGVAVGVQPDVVVSGQPQRRPPSVSGATGGRASMAWRSAAIQSAGAQPGARRTRVLTRAVHSASWALKSAAEANSRPGRNEVSR